MENRWNPLRLEKYSSAFTLSDMEVFIFPELMFSLVLANIMAPAIWRWRTDPWFAKMDRLSPYRRVLRLKQFIMDHYEFNLDLETWGLTTQPRELARFAPWVDPATVARSNALFGYQGDRHYFDLDIRRHFGLDKYTLDTIPYWKTETVDAMDAFRFKPGFRTGAGECVSLAALYTAALFVVCRIPLEDIFLMATPLHSQNFICVQDGVLTNNRRIVTKAMWFNGTALTVKAQRALRHEEVTIVTHVSGHVHAVYPDATIDPEAYKTFQKKLRAFLCTSLDQNVLAAFLRQYSDLQGCFQLRQEKNGRARYIALERLYHYEQSCPFQVGDDTLDPLLNTVDEFEFRAEPLEGRISFNRFSELLSQVHRPATHPDELRKVAQQLQCRNDRTDEILERLIQFIRLDPALPGAGKNFTPAARMALTPEMTREDIIARVEAQRAVNETADLAFYALRDFQRIEWPPFLKAALERNPVSVQGLAESTDSQVIERLAGLPAESIYEGPRLAQPDEVWNFGRGDGLEKAVLLAGVWKIRHPEAAVEIRSDGHTALTLLPHARVEWPTAKGIACALKL